MLLGLLTIFAFMFVVISVTEALIIMRNEKRLQEIEGKGFVNVKKSPCPPERGGHHQWEYVENSPMVCKKCKFVAGTFKSDKGDY